MLGATYGPASQVDTHPHVPLQGHGQRPFQPSLGHSLDSPQLLHGAADVLSPALLLHRIGRLLAEPVRLVDAPLLPVGLDTGRPPLPAGLPGRVVRRAPEEIDQVAGLLRHGPLPQLPSARQPYPWKRAPHRAEPGAHEGRADVTPPIDLPSDLNAEDDDGLNWALLDKATDPARVHVGSVLVAGTARFWSVVRVIAVDDDGQVHFEQLDANDPAARRLLASVA